MYCMKANTADKILRFRKAKSCQMASEKCASLNENVVENVVLVVLRDPMCQYITR